MATLSLILSCLTTALVALLLYRRTTAEKRRLPPGPKPMPILGNIRDLPPSGCVEYQHWLKHKDLYGPISSITVFGMTMIIIHDRRMARELLDQTSSKTSGRPTMVMVNEMCGYDQIILCQSYTPLFRRYRKMLHQELGTVVSAAQFQSRQEVEVGRQLVRTLQEPKKWLAHLKTTAAATILDMTYGYRAEPHKSDTLVDTIEQMMSEFSQASVPMAWAPDILPILKHLPQGFPGATFQKMARQWKRTIRKVAYVPYRFVRQQMLQSRHRPSYASKLVEQLEHDSQDGRLRTEDEEAIAWTAASLYGAGADTTVITLTAFTLAMLKFPSVQRKAQTEIDAVTGRLRLPTFSDRGRLPYVSAMVKEASRWWPIAPMSFPHTVTEAFKYRGYTIPAGAFLLPAVYWFLHDPDVYPDPDAFEPERFLPPRNEPDPTEAFGHGRRLCPGRFFADAALFINVAQSLACFNIKPAVNEKGAKVGVDDVKPKPGIVTMPMAFEYQIEVRSDKHAQLIQDIAAKHPFEAGDSDLLLGISSSFK